MKISQWGEVYNAWDHTVSSDILAHKVEYALKMHIMGGQMINHWIHRFPISYFLRFPIRGEECIQSKHDMINLSVIIFTAVVKMLISLHQIDNRSWQEMR